MSSEEQPKNPTARPPPSNLGIKETVDKLIENVKEGNEEEVSKILNTKISKNEFDHTECTMTHFILVDEFKQKVRVGQKAVSTRTTPSQCVFVNATEHDGGYCALHWAAYKEHEHIVLLLLKCGADPTRVTSKGNTALHLAVSRGNERIVRILLDHVLNSGGNLINYMNAKTSSSGNSALHVASKNEHFSIVAGLLRHGAAYDMKNNSGQKPVDICTDRQITDLLKVIEVLFQDAKQGKANVNDRLKQARLWDLSVRGYYPVIIMSTLNQDEKTIEEVETDNKHEGV